MNFCFVLYGIYREKRAYVHFEHIWENVNVRLISILLKII